MSVFLFIVGALAILILSLEIRYSLYEAVFWINYGNVNNNGSRFIRRAIVCFVIMITIIHALHFV